MRRMSLSALGIGIMCLVALTAQHASGQDQPPPNNDSQEGFAERLGAQIDRGVQQLGSELREGWANLRETINELSVQGRVYARLRWDKAIAIETIDVGTVNDGIVKLTGTVTTESMKRKAVQLARDTVGVQEVVDQLTVRPTDVTTSQ